MNILQSKNIETIFAVTLGFIYLTAGLNKIISGFPHIIGPPYLVAELSKYELGLFAYFIAVCQVMCGASLLHSQSRLIGALMLLPMQLCVFIVPISLGWQGTPYINGAFLLMLLYVLNKHRGVLLSLFLENSDAAGYPVRTYGLTFTILCVLTAFLNYV